MIAYFPLDIQIMIFSISLEQWNIEQFDQIQIDFLRLLFNSIKIKFNTSEMFTPF